MDNGRQSVSTKKLPNADTILVIAVLLALVQVCCLGPALLGDWISLTTDPDELPSAICNPPPRRAILTMWGREAVFLLSGGFSLFLLARAAGQGRLWAAVRRWGVPVVLCVAAVILVTMNLPTPLQDTPPCTGPVNLPIYGYPFAWVMHPGKWTATTDAYGFTFYSFSTYYLALNIVFLTNLAVCGIGLPAVISARKPRDQRRSGQ